MKLTEVKRTRTFNLEINEDDLRHLIGLLSYKPSYGERYQEIVYDVGEYIVAMALDLEVEMPVVSEILENN